MPDGYKIGPNLAGTLHDMVRDYRGAAGGGPPVTRIPTSFDDGPQSHRPIRIGTFGTSSWNINASNTVTLTNVGVTGYTVLVTNLFGNIGTGSSSRYCAVAKDGTAWYLIQAACD